MYVVGFMASDGPLGRTFVTSTEERAARIVTKLIEALGDTTPPDANHWADACTWYTELGVYFIGELETTDWEDNDA